MKTKKFILGDHKQLCPYVANYASDDNYELKTSLFERMVKNDMPSYILAEQHRMRPEIVGLVAPAIYPDLKNHPSVENQPHIKGVDKDLYFITNESQEIKVYL